MANTLPIVIIGAGAAGLLAAAKLSAAGLAVTLLEAAGRPGGRIFTLEDGGFSRPVEAGAEFIHGSLPLTLGLLRDAGIDYHPIQGKMARVRQGIWEKEDNFTENWDELMEKMGEIQQDLSLAEFLATYFPGEKYRALRESAGRFAEGFDLADIGTASTKALYGEWNEEGQQQYRVDGGYGRLIRFLADQCLKQGCILNYSEPARDIEWRRGGVVVTTSAGRRFMGSKLIVTASLGVLQQGAIPPFTPDPSSFALRFSPAIPGHLQAAGQLGYGAVIKILMEFKTHFWEEGSGFILSDEYVPTWWTQEPDRRPLLTGWLTAGAMRDFQKLDETARIRLCLLSLANIFSRDISFLQQQLIAAYIGDWSRAPFIAGGYSFETVGGAAARDLLRQPLEDTLFFCGEALYEGSSPATVEAAFCSGQETADKIIAQS